VKYVLIVDDNIIIADTLKLILGACMRDVSFRTAANGKEAVEILQSRPVDLILTDINMPVMDGYQLIEYRNQHHPRVPLVVMTADASQEVVRRLSMLGITDCLEKPLSYETVTRMFLEKLAADEPAPALGPNVAICR
jgi:CheY-like chemotaxis protein